VACIGVGGQGWFNLRAISRSTPVTAICDVDFVALERAHRSYPDCPCFSSIEQLFEQPEAFDAVVISIPDHAHLEAIVLSLRHDKHCFCEKPLVHDLEALRHVRDTLQGSNSVSCLGCQGAYSSRFSYLTHLLRAIPLDEVVELVAWTDRPGAYWNASPARLSTCAGSREQLNWMGWLSRAESEEYDESLHPMRWRARKGFGTSPIGDMGSHLLALPMVAFHGEGVSNCDIVRKEHGSTSEYPDSLELTAIIHAGDGDLALRWYHGAFSPDRSPFGRIRCAENGILLKLEDRDIYIPEWNCSNAFEFRGGEARRLFDGLTFEPEIDIFDQWITASRDHRKMLTDFESFGIPFMTVLLGLLRAIE